MRRYAIRFSLKQSQFDKITAAAKGSGLTAAAFARMHVLNAARKWRTLPSEESLEQYCPECFSAPDLCKDPVHHRALWTDV